MAKETDLKSLYEMIDAVISGICAFELREDKFRLLYMNEGGYRMLGYTPEQGRKWVNNMLSLILDEDRKKFWQAVEDVMKDDGAVDLEFRTVTAQGSLRWLQVRANLYEKTKDRAIIVAVFLDATDRKFVENEMQMQSGWYQALLEAEGEILLDYNVKTDVLAIKTAGKYGLENRQMIDRYFHKLKENKSRASDISQILAVLERCMRMPDSEILELKTSLMAGQEKRWYRMNISSIAGVEGYVTHVVGKMTDIQERKELEEQLKNQHRLDMVTGWYNREACAEQVMKIINHSRGNEIHALMIVNMENLKFVSEQLGDETGDRILKDVARKMETTFKRSDVLGRLSHEEFAVFVQNVGSLTNLDMLAQKLYRCAQVRIGAGDEQIVIGADIGIAVCPYHGKKWEELEQKANEAVGMVRESEGEKYRIYGAVDAFIDFVGSAANDPLHVYEDDGTHKSLENILMAILREEDTSETSGRAMLELIARHYKMQFAYLAVPVDGKIHEIRYFEEGFGPKEGVPLKNWVEFLKEMEFLFEFKVIHSYDIIPEELGAYMLRQRLNTIAINPIYSCGEAAGAFILGDCAGMDWNVEGQEKKDLLRIIQIVQLYALHVIRQNQGENLLHELTVLDNFDSYALAVSVDNYELCFANKKALEAIPDLQIGDFCYRTFAKKEKPCDMCHLRHMNRTDPQSKWSEERFSTALRSWLKAHDSWLDFESENPVCLVNCMDISEYFMK